MKRLPIVLAFCAVGLVPQHALAQSGFGQSGFGQSGFGQSGFGQSAGLAEGSALYDEADFEGAIERLERALAEEALSAPDVERALDRIAASELATGARSLDRTLAILALVAPAHRFGADVPGALARRFEAAASTVSPLRVEIRASLGPAGSRHVEANVTADPLRMVREVELRCAEVSARGTAPSLELAVEVDCEAVARGPGGVEVARGMRAAPQRSPLPAPGEGGSDEDELWIALGIGGGAVVVGILAAVIAVAADEGPSDVVVIGPGVRL